MPEDSVFATDYSLSNTSHHNNEELDDSSTRQSSPLQDEPKDHGLTSPSAPSQRIAWIANELPKPKKEASANQEKRPQHNRSGSGKASVFSFRESLRGYDDDDETDWWFASTACPLLAATIAPLANVLSIAALVTYWRMNVSDGNGGILPDFLGTPFKDPRWCTGINAGSLVCGFLGNIFLLFNFTGRIRYIIALPASIILFYCANFMVSISFFLIDWSLTGSVGRHHIRNACIRTSGGTR